MMICVLSCCDLAFWDNTTENYFSDLIAKCNSCKETTKPEPSRRVSLYTFYRHFNVVSYIDLFCFDGQPVLRIMYKQTRYSARALCEYTSFATAAAVFGATCPILFWALNAIQTEGASRHGELQTMLSLLEIKFHAVARRHSKNVLGSQQSPIHSISLRLCKHDKNLLLNIATKRALRISHDLYRNDILSTFKMTHEFTRLVVDTITTVEPELVEAENRLVGKRKLTGILRLRVCHHIL